MKEKKVFVASFIQMLIQIRREPMLLISLFAPFFAGAMFRFGVPQLESILIEHFDMTECIQPYYLLFDLFLILLAPTMFCFASAMVILMEVDDNIAMYYFVTPLERKGYLIGRLLLPSILGGMESIIILSLFHLTLLSFLSVVIYVVLGTVISSIVSLMVIAIASNKVEGMAVTKLSGLILVGILVPFFVEPPYQYLSAILPSFWLGKYAVSQDLWYAALSAICAGIWIYGLTMKFQKKIGI